MKRQQVINDNLTLHYQPTDHQQVINHLKSHFPHLKPHFTVRKSKKKRKRKCMGFFQQDHTSYILKPGWHLSHTHTHTHTHTKANFQLQTQRLHDSCFTQVQIKHSEEVITLSGVHTHYHPHMLLLLARSAWSVSQWRHSALLLCVCVCVCVCVCSALIVSLLSGSGGGGGGACSKQSRPQYWSQPSKIISLSSPFVALPRLQMSFVK